MKAIFISENIDDIKDIISFTENLGGNTILYNFPMKAIDNFEEILPDLVVINAIDFPRHWKVIVQHISNLDSDIETKIVLLVNDYFQIEESEKADYLNVPLCLNINNRIEEEYQEFKNIVSSLILHDNYMPFAFLNASTGDILIGCIDNITLDGLTCKCYHIVDSSLSIGQKIENTVLKTKKEIFHPKCIITSIDGNKIDLDFVGMSRLEKRYLHSCL